MNDSGSIWDPARGATDRSLVARAQAHSPDAWRRLVELYGPLVFHWCRSSRLESGDAAEVMQEVFREVAQGIGGFPVDQPGGSFRAWLRGITQERLRKFFGRQPQRAAPASGSAAEAAPGSPADGSFVLPEGPPGGDINIMLHAALDLVRPGFDAATWQAFWDVAVQGREPATVAAESGLSVSAVYKARSRVLRRLREELGDTLEAPPHGG